MRILLVLIVFAWNSPCAFSQSGYFGQMRNFGIGLTTNFSFFSFKGVDEHNLIIEDDNLVFFPKIELEYSIQHKRTIFDFQARYQMLPNIIQQTSSSAAGPDLEESISDITKMKSDVYRIGTGIKTFGHVAPMGIYFRFGFGINLTHNKTISSKSIESFMYSEGTYLNSKVNTVTQGLTVIPDVTISIGKLIPTGKRTALDFGIQSNYRLMKLDYKNESAPELGNSPFNRWINSRALISNNLLEVYAKIHLFY